MIPSDAGAGPFDPSNKKGFGLRGGGGGNGNGGRRNGNGRPSKSALTAGAVLMLVIGGLLGGQLTPRFFSDLENRVTKLEANIVDREEVVTETELREIKETLRGMDERLRDIEQEMVTEDDLRALVVQLNND